MGQISDEIWKTIRLNESIKDDIKGTVERILNKKAITIPQTSEESSIPSLPHENQIAGSEANGVIKTPTTTPTSEANILNSNEAIEGGDRIAQSKNSDMQEKEQMQALVQKSPELLDQTKAKDLLAGDADDDADLPPGFS